MDCKDKGRGYLWIYLHMLNEFLHEKNLSFLQWHNVLDELEYFFWGYSLLTNQAFWVEFSLRTVLSRFLLLIVIFPILKRFLYKTRVRKKMTQPSCFIYTVSFHKNYKFCHSFLNHTHKKPWNTIGYSDQTFWGNCLRRTETRF